MGGFLFLCPSNAYVLRAGDTIIAIKLDHSMGRGGAELHPQREIRNGVIVHNHHRVNLGNQGIQLTLQLIKHWLVGNYNGHNFDTGLRWGQNRSVVTR